MTREFHPLVKRVLDGELTLGDLPLKLRPEAEEALRMLAALDRTPVTLSPGLDVRVMETVRRRAGSPATARESFRAVRVWRWISAPRDVEIRLRVRPWAVGALAAAAVLVPLLLARPDAAPRGAAPAPATASSPSPERAPCENSLPDGLRGARRSRARCARERRGPARRARACGGRCGCARDR